MIKARTKQKDRKEKISKREGLFDFDIQNVLPFRLFTLNYSFF